MRHPLLSINPKSKDYDPEEATELCFTWLTTTFSNKNYQSKWGHGYETKCDCCKDLGSAEEMQRARAISEYMVCWSGFPSQTQRELLYQWNNLSEIMAENSNNTSNIKYTLPMTKYDNCSLKNVCKNALMNVLNVGAMKWKSSVANPLQRHHLIGKKEKNETKVNK